MKATAIPAQITTIEDRIAGSLSLLQLILLTTPLFLSAVVFFLGPPFGRYSLYKLIISCLLMTLSSSLAIRIDSKLVLDLLRQRGLYFLTPHTYTYRRKLMIARPVEPIVISPRSKFPKNHHAKSSVLSQAARSKGQRLLRDNQYRVAFQTKAGGLSVKVSSVE